MKQTCYYLATLDYQRAEDIQIESSLKIWKYNLNNDNKLRSAGTANNFQLVAQVYIYRYM